MRRKLLAFSMTLALLLSVFSVANVGAHKVDIEINNQLPANNTPVRDWFGVEPDTGQGAIMRNSAQQGEFIFNDASKDQRVINPTDVVSRAVDLSWFGVTADATNLYFLAKVDRYNGITQSPSIELMITIDRDHATGGTDFKTTLPLNNPALAQTKVPDGAAWEYTVNTAFQPGPGGPTDPPFVKGSTKIWTNTAATQTSTSCNTTECPSQLAAAKVPSGSFAEIAVPWAKIGNVPTGASFLRFTVAIMYSNRAVPTVGTDTYNSPVMDVLGIGKTIDDIGDGQMASTDAFDVHFDTNTATPTYEPYAPLLISEFQPNPLGSDTPTTGNPNQSEWIEIYNPNSFPVSLSDYKIGNAAKRSTSSSNTQGMFRFKTGSIAAGATLIVARDEGRFLLGHPSVPASQVLNLSTDLTKYTPWSNGNSIVLDNGPTAPATEFEEQILLLDAQDDIIDLVNYGNSTTPTPGNIQIGTAAVPEAVSYERCPAGLDTNGGFDPSNPAADNTDFVAHQTLDKQTPGVPCAGRPGIDMALAKTSDVTNGIGNDPVVFTLSYSNVGAQNELQGATVTIVDTLPAGLTFVSATPAPTTISGQTLTWSGLTPPAHGGVASTITVNTKINAGLPQNTPLVNTATISSPNEQTEASEPGIRENNTAQATVTTVGPALLQPSFSFSGLGGSTPFNSTFEFKLNYGNTGQTDATDTSITLTIPAKVRILSADAPGATANFLTPIDGPTTLSWSIANLASNTSGSITLRAQVLTGAGSSLPFSAKIQGVSGESTQVSATASGSQKVGFNKTALPLVIK